MAMSTSMALVVDGIIVGNLLSTRHLAAVNLVTPLILCFSTFFAMIGVGGSTIMAYARGSRDLQRSSRILSLSVATLFGISMCFPIIAFFFLPNVTSFLSSDPRLSSLVESYSQILLRSEEHTSELQSRPHLVCRLLLEKKKNKRVNIL